MDPVFNLCHGVDVEVTREKMEHYRRDHQTLIMKNRDKQVSSSTFSDMGDCSSLCPVCSVVMIG